MENETAQPAGLIIMEPLGATKKRNFTRFMAEAGDLVVVHHMNLYPGMQLLNVADILDGKLRTLDAAGGEARKSTG